MSGLHTILRESIGGPWPGESQTTQAHSTIPCGTVRDLCQSFEDRISAHEYERDQIFIDRATRNMDELIRQNRTYAEQLRLAEDATLFNLPAHILGFLRDHDNLYRAAVRSRLAIRSAFASPHIDVLVQVASRLQNIRNVYYINMVEMTRSPSEQRRLMHDPLFNEVFRQCTYSLQDEIICRLTHFDSLLLPLSGTDVELENIGPDHVVNDHGHDIPDPAPTSLDDRDHSQRCCICLENYTPTHPAFLISKCLHAVGKPCLMRWLNSTSRNATSCPHCRTLLCERRDRRPAGLPAATQAESRRVSDRLARAIIMLGSVERIYDELFGRDAASEYRKEAMDELNYRLFERDVGFCLEFGGPGAGYWGVRRVRWH